NGGAKFIDFAAAQAGIFQMDEDAGDFVVGRRFIQPLNDLRQVRLQFAKNARLARTFRVRFVEVKAREGNFRFGFIGGIFLFVGGVGDGCKRKSQENQRSTT